MYSNHAIRARSKTDMTLNVELLRQELTGLSPQAAQSHLLIMCALWESQNLLLSLDMRRLAVAANVRQSDFTRYYWPQIKPLYRVATSGAKQYIFHPYLTVAAERQMAQIDRQSADLRAS